MSEIWKYRLLYIVAIVLLAIIDQASKLWAVMILGGKNLPITVIEKYVELRLTFNTGAVWGIFPGWTQGLAVLSTAMIIIILTLLGRTHLKDRLLGWAFTFQLGGAIGNLIDRVARKSVVDFINVYIPLGGGEGGFWDKLFTSVRLEGAAEFASNRIPSLYNWPTFNFADAWVVIGTFLLLIYILIMPSEKPKVKEKMPELVSAGEGSLLSREEFPDSSREASKLDNSELNSDLNKKSDTMNDTDGG